MTDSEKIKMEINIGDQSIDVTVPFDQQDFVRDLEAEIGRVYSTFLATFPHRQISELLAMILYRYASNYRKLAAVHNRALQMARDCSEAIDNIQL